MAQNFKAEFLPLLDNLKHPSLNNFDFDAFDDDDLPENLQYAANIQLFFINDLGQDIQNLGVPPGNLQPASILPILQEKIQQMQPRGAYDLEFFEHAYPGNAQQKWNEFHNLLIAMRNHIQNGDAGNQEGGRRRSRKRRGGRRVSRRRRGGRRVSRKRRGRRGTKKNSY
jgi:hypothetical protein